MVNPNYDTFFLDPDLNIIPAALYGAHVSFSISTRNTIYHNNFVNNTIQVDDVSPEYSSIWDNGYPSGGNYWSNYNGVDLHTGTYQNIIGSDGIGDTPYAIDVNNTDHYPLTNLYSTGSLSVTISPSSAKLLTHQSQLFRSTVCGGTLVYTYQWYLNGEAVPDATSSSWTFDQTSAGTYTVYAKVTDNVGAQATSITAVVNVQAISWKGPFYNWLGIEYWIVRFAGERPMRIVGTEYC
jgi:hypothetical protein